MGVGSYRQARLHVVPTVSRLTSLAPCVYLVSPFCLQFLPRPRVIYTFLYHLVNWILLWVSSACHCWASWNQSSLQSRHRASHLMDASYQAGQSSQPPRRPDIKKKLVVVGDGARGQFFRSLCCRSLEYDLRWLWEDLSTHCLCRKSLSGGMFTGTVATLAD